MNEATLCRKILKYLNRIDGCKAVKFHGNAFTQAGTPDIICCYQGRAVLFEVKVGRNDATEIQRYQMSEWESAGAIVRVVRSLDGVKKTLFP